MSDDRGKGSGTSFVSATWGAVRFAVVASAVLAGLWGASAVRAAQGIGPSASEDLDAVRQAVAQGDYAEAMLLAGRRTKEAREAIRQEAIGSADLQQRVNAWRAWLAYEPFSSPFSEHLPGLDRVRIWAEGAARYLAARRAALPPGAPPTDELQRDEQARAPFEQMLALAEKDPADEFDRLARGFLAEHWQSTYLPAAADVIAAAQWDQREGSRWPRPVWRYVLDQMQDRPLPAASRIALLWASVGDVPNGADELALARAIADCDAARALTDDPYLRARCLFEAARFGVKSRQFDQHEAARQRLAQILQEHPQWALTAEARSAVVRSWLLDRAPDRAQRAVHEFEGQSPPGASFAREWLAIADHYVHEGSAELAVPLYEEVIRRYPQDALVPQAWFALGRVYQQRGDAAKMVRAYEEAMRFRPPTGTPQWTAQDARAEAREAMARHYMRQGEWEKALQAWQEWRPVDWYNLQEDQTLQMALCLAHLGRARDAALLIVRFVNKQRHDVHPQLIAVLVRLYHEADQLPDLRRIVQQYEERRLAEAEREGHNRADQPWEYRRFLPTWPAWEFMRLAELEDQGNIAALIEICREGDFSDGTGRADRDNARADFAAEALARFGGREVEPLREAIETSLEPDPGLAWALGRSRAPEALATLEELTTGGVLRRSPAAIQSLALHGEAGARLLRAIGADPNHPQATLARQWLDRAADVIPPTPWPPIPKGVLPSTWDQCLAGAEPEPARGPSPFGE